MNLPGRPGKRGHGGLPSVHQVLLALFCWTAVMVQFAVGLNLHCKVLRITNPTMPQYDLIIKTEDHFNVRQYDKTVYQIMIRLKDISSAEFMVGGIKIHDAKLSESQALFLSSGMRWAVRPTFGLGGWCDCEPDKGLRGYGHVFLQAMDGVQWATLKDPPSDKSRQVAEKKTKSVEEVKNIAVTITDDYGLRSLRLTFWWHLPDVPKGLDDLNGDVQMKIPPSLAHVVMFDKTTNTQFSLEVGPKSLSDMWRYNFPLSSSVVTDGQWTPLDDNPSVDLLQRGGNLQNFMDSRTQAFHAKSHNLDNVFSIVEGAAIPKHIDIAHGSTKDKFLHSSSIDKLSSFLDDHYLRDLLAKAVAERRSAKCSVLRIINPGSKERPFVLVTELAKSTAYKLSDTHGIDADVAQRAKVVLANGEAYTAGNRDDHLDRLKSSLSVLSWDIQPTFGGVRESCDMTPHDDIRGLGLYVLHEIFCDSDHSAASSVDAGDEWDARPVEGGWKSRYLLKEATKFAKEGTGLGSILEIEDKYDDSTVTFTVLWKSNDEQDDDTGDLPVPHMVFLEHSADPPWGATESPPSSLLQVNPSRWHALAKEQDLFGGGMWTPSTAPVPRSLPTGTLDLSSGDAKKVFMVGCSEAIRMELYNLDKMMRAVVEQRHSAKGDRSIHHKRAPKLDTLTKTFEGLSPEKETSSSDEVVKFVPLVEGDEGADFKINFGELRKQFEKFSVQGGGRMNHKRTQKRGRARKGKKKLKLRGRHHRRNKG